MRMAQQIDIIIKNVLLENQLELVMTCLVLVNLMRCQSVSSSWDSFFHLFFQLFVLQVILVRPVPVYFPQVKIISTAI